MSEKSDMRDQVFSGMIWKFAERISAQLVSFVVSVVLARILLPEAYGIVALVMVFINIANVFVTSGFGNALVQKKNADETDFSTIFYCSFVVSIVLYLVLFFAAPFIAKYYQTEELTAVLRVFSIKIVLSSYSSVQHAYVSKHMIFKKFFFATILGTVLSGVVGIVMALKGFGVWALVAQYLVNSIVDAMVLSFTVKWRPRLLFSWNAAKGLMGYGWKLLCASLIGTLYGNLRSLIIGRYYTKDDLAYYNRGKNFPDLVMNNVVSTITSVLFPAMSNAGNKDEIRRMTQKSISITSYIVFPMMAGMALVAKPFILVLLTEKWSAAIIYLQLVCLYNACHMITQTNLQAINALGRSDVVLKLEFIKKPVGILLLIAAIPHGVFAVALTLPLSAIFTMLVNMQPNRKLLSYGFLEQIKDLFPALLLTGGMSVVVYVVGLLPIHNLLLLILQICVGGGVYIFLSVFTKNESFFYLWNYMVSWVKKRRA